MELITEPIASVKVAEKSTLLYVMLKEISGKNTVSLVHMNGYSRNGMRNGYITKQKRVKRELTSEPVLSVAK
jgi:hypothetical protein